jgi:hypothetical protein
MRRGGNYNELFQTSSSHCVFEKAQENNKKQSTGVPRFSPGFCPINIAPIAKTVDNEGPMFLGFYAFLCKKTMKIKFTNFDCGKQIRVF